MTNCLHETKRNWMVYLVYCFHAFLRKKEYIRKVLGYVYGTLNINKIGQKNISFHDMYPELWISLIKLVKKRTILPYVYRTLNIINKIRLKKHTILPF